MSGAGVKAAAKAGAKAGVKVTGVKAAGKLGKVVGKAMGAGVPANIAATVGPVLWKQMVRFLKTNHGSKVVDGQYKECPIGVFGGDKAFISMKKKGQVIYLTKDTVQKYGFVLKKYCRTQRKEYYYYDVEFADGTYCRLKMGERCKNAFLKYMKMNKHHSEPEEEQAKENGEDQKLSEEM